MINARPLARANFYLTQYCLRRPLTVLILALICCLLFVVYEYYPETPSYDSFAAPEDGQSNFENNRSPRRADKVSTNNPLAFPFKYGTLNENEAHLKLGDLMNRVEDLNRIKLSISNELRLIEREKVKLLKEKASLVSKNDRLTLQINKGKAQLKQFELDISSNRRRKFEQTCDVEHIPPVVMNPMKSLDFKELSGQSLGQVRNDLISISQKEPNPSSRSFDLSLCPLTKEFKFYLREPTKSSVSTNTDEQFKIESSQIRETLRSHRQYTENSGDACLIVTVFDSNMDLDLDSKKNNLVISLMSGEIFNFSESVPYAAIASNSFHGNSFRSNFDLVLPSVWRPPSSYDLVVNSIPPQSPSDRKYLASYFGLGYSHPMNKSRSAHQLYQLNSIEKTLQVIHRNSINDLFLFIYDCGEDSDMQCFEEKDFIIESSTFLLIVPSLEVIDDNTNDQLYLALSRGAIPVIIGKENTNLPFSEVVDWRKAAILMNVARLPELHFILRSIGPADVYQLKYHGRHIFKNYLATVKQVLDTTISVMSVERFSYPPPPVQNVETITYYSKKEIVYDVNCTTKACIESKSDTFNELLSFELLGPREIPFASPSYRRNFSLTLSSTYDLWNNPMYSPLQLFPSSPLDPVPPSEYKFFTANQGYRPIGEGLGGSGYEFSRALGGDYPKEQFTIVLLTYEREAMLMKTLERLKGLPYLNKILVVWNGVKHRPQDTMIWPDVGVPIVVVKVPKNSLNNRFLPYDVIETDAILSLDDDSPLRQDEIVFAFRVWRQSRDRIVGFPGRFHAWDVSQSSWMYNSNHSCELSMVLTGGAFFHRYYSYMYTYSMPEVIRSIVDRFMNCEDIAMNFLVSHLTRKPPIKVTSRWTFHCPGCQSSLSEDDTHFRERHECLNTFASIYGYMPLLNTQSRSDSVLFKTRLPHDKQKCFRFV